MATDDDCHAAEAAEFQKKLDAMVATATDTKKQYDVALARVLATTVLLEEEQRTATVLAEEAHAAAALIEPPSPTPPPAPTGHAASSDDDYEAIAIANIHVHAVGMQNIRSLVSVTLDLSSTHYARWRNNVLLTLGHYSLSDHVLLDTTYVGVSAWDWMDSIIKSWIWGIISHDLQDITQQHGHTARDAWLALENHFLGNCETRALHIDATFRSFVQGDLSINDYCQKMKGFTVSLTDLSVDATDRILVLNVLCGLIKNFEHLCTIFTHVTPFRSFQKVLANLCQEKIQQGIQGLPATASTPTTLYAA
jgi:hypothetical protein